MPHMKPNRRKRPAHSAATTTRKHLLQRLVAIVGAFVLALSGMTAAVVYADETGPAFTQDPVGAVMHGWQNAVGAAPRAADGAHDADGMTINDWRNYMNESVSTGTANVGRIWTDKSVSTGNITLDPNGGTVTKSKSSDFLVALSALSSTSNKVTYTDKPLDIVLVLDTSGSMAYRMPVYDDGTLDRNATYYTDSGEDSNTTPPDYGYEVEWNEQRQEWGYYTRRPFGGQTWNAVTPTTSSSDNNRYRTQLYGPTRLSALQDAVNGFIDSTAERNEDANADSRHRVSIVTFESSADTDRALTDCYGNNVTTLKNTVNGLRANGGTRADLGLEQAQSALSGQGSRANAQKVVIFFTDGQPGLYRFEDAIAGEAINEARDMKADDVTIYSIGVVEGANPSNTTSDINRYLHAISSNYPEASCPIEYMGWASSSSWSGYDYTWGNYGDFGQLDLGTPASGEEGEPAPEYYFAAEDAEGLSDVFAQIAQDMEPSSAGIPTEVESGFNMDASGYITFTDTLGAYMEVDPQQDVTVVYKNTPYKAEYSDGSYALPDQQVEGNYVAQNGQSLSNINQIVFEVQKSENYALQGDTVTLKIPASLIPLLHYNVNTENGQTTITNDANETFPIRALYGVKLIDGMDEKLANPDSALSNYLENNSTEDGTQAYFYSNDWQRSSQGVQTELGSTTASFNPSQNNAFYYFQEDTPVYTNAECTDPATQEDLRGGGSLYYKFTYDMPGNNEDTWYAIEVDKANFTNHPGYYAINNRYNPSVNNEIEDGQVYIRDEAPRLSRAKDFDTPKAQNVTETATQALRPSWTSTSNAQTVSVALGNNGRLAVDIPGALAVTKDVTVPSNFPAEDVAYHEGVPFEFTIHVDGANGAYAAAVIEDGETTTIEDGITFNNGDARYELHDGQQLIIYGLDNGAQYTVTETEKDGYTATKTGDTGTIVANDTQTAAFTNAYEVKTPAKVEGAADLVGSKAIDGRAWIDDESYTFMLASLSGTSGDEGTVVDTAVVEGDPAQGEDAISFNFKDLTFEAPGVYWYTIYEDDNSSTIPAGVTTSRARYRVTITVTDNHDGTLKAETKIQQTSDDQGNALNPWGEPGTAKFVNTYKVGETEATIQAEKAVADAVGSGYKIDNDDFQFILKPAGDNAASIPMPADAQGEGADRQATLTNTGSTAQFGVPFTNDDFPEGENTAEFWYTLTEDSTYNPVPGMEYSEQTYWVKVTITRTTNELGEAVIGTNVEYFASADGSQPATDNKALFTNTFDPADVTTEGEDAIKGTKTVDGRNWNGDSYKFTIAEAEGHENQTGVTMPQSTEVTVSDDASDKVDGQAYDFSFDAITFSHVGSYYFTITETGEFGTGNGMKYDEHKTNVTVTVGVDEENGTLEITKIEYDNEGVVGASTELAQYTNVYNASFDFGEGDNGGIQVVKELDGRTQLPAEFGFTIKAVSSDTVAAEEAEALLDSTDRSFNNNADGAMQKLMGEGFNFDQDDAGKTFSYVVDELSTKQELDGAGSRLTMRPGVTYDQNSYRVDIAVVDDGDGSMYVETTVTPCNANGEVSGDPVYNGSTENEDYTIPTVTFENDYVPDSATYDTSADALLNKVIDGRAWLETDEFTFTIAADSSLDGNLADEAMPASTTATLSGADYKGTASDEKVPFGFGELTFSKPGTYQYIVKEDKAGTEEEGITYASNTAVIKFVVEDDPDSGKLVITNTDIVENGTFTNEYKASVSYDAVGGLELKKTLENHVLAADQFTFEIQVEDGGAGNTYEPTNPAPTSGDNVAQWVPEPFDGDVTFDQSMAGETTTITITEKNAGAAGYTYDDAKYTVEITPVDNGDGTMSVHTVVKKEGVEEPIFNKTTSEESPETAVLEFTNTYGADAVTDDVSADVTATKTLTGRDMNEGEFNFEIVTSKAPGFEGEFQEQVVATGTNAAAKDGEPGAITFKSDPAGAMTYTIAELDEAEADGYATKSVDEETGNATWILCYKVQEDETSLPNKVTAITGGLSFTVTVEEDGKGNLTATVNDGNGLEFENEYEPDPVTVGKDGDAQIVVQKTFTGRPGNEWLDSDSFEFTIKAETENAPVPDPATVKVTNGSTQVEGIDGAFSAIFGDITYTKEMLGDEMTKDFVYTITETAPADSGSGITKDTHIAKVTVTVTDNGEGQLKAEVKYDNTAATTEADKAVDNAATFTNTYKAGDATLEGATYLKASKTLTGRDWQDGEQVDIVLRGDKGTPAPDGTLDPDADRWTYAVHVSKDGSFSFPNIEYTADDL